MSGRIKDSLALPINPMGVVVLGSVRDIQEALIYTMAEDKAGYSADVSRYAEPRLPPGVRDLLLDTSEEGFMSNAMRRRKCRDTSLGGNEAINCFPQFCMDDDIIWPLDSLNPMDTDPKTGMGRVYSEIYDNNQVILQMTCGVPVFANPIDFFSNTVDAQLSQMLNSGDVPSTLSRMFGYGVGMIISLPFLPLKWIASMYKWLVNNHVSKYYEFRPTMALFNRTWNTFLVHTGTNMHIAKAMQEASTNTTDTKKTMYEKLMETPEKLAAAIYSNVTVFDARDGSSTGRWEAESPYRDGGFQTFLMSGFDIFRILSKRVAYQKGTGFRLPSNYTTDNWLEKQAKEANDAERNYFWDSFDAMTTESSLYVGYSIGKSANASESLSNSTKESSLAQTLNGYVDSGRDQKFLLAGLGKTVETTANIFSNGIAGLVAGAGELLQIGAASNFRETMKGNAVVDLPEVYSGTSFSKSYSFDITFRAFYGNPISIFSDIITPLGGLICAGFPRGVGRNAYTSPYNLRCYVRGMVAIPHGIMENLNINRGNDQFGWNNNHLPTVVKVSFGIKDLSPATYVTLAADGDDGIAIMGQNSNYQEYLMTLSGLGLRERLLFLKNLERKLKTIWGSFSSTWLNTSWLGMEAGNSMPGKIISMFRPSNLSS